MKFLIIRFSSIGDIVLTTPVVRCLKQQMPDAEIHFLTKQAFRGLVDPNPYIDKVMVLGPSWELMIHQLRDEGYDHIIDLHHNLRSLRVKRALHPAPSTSFNKLNFKKWLLTAFKINLLPREHIVDRYLRAVQAFGVTNDGGGLDYFIPEHEKLQIEDLPTSHQMGYIGVVIGAALETKQLPKHKLMQLCSAIEYPVVLLGGPEDKAAGEEIAALDNIKIYNACGKFTLHESAGLVKHAKLIISHDTGLMHIASAFQKTILSVWGNTVPQFGMAAYFGAKEGTDTRFEVRGLWCRPCSKIGFHRCPLGHFKCMERQDVKAIANAAIAAVHR